MVRIPGDCWHGFKVVDNEQATLVNFVTNLYDYENPDEERLPPVTTEIPMDIRRHIGNNVTIVIYLSNWRSSRS
jgi:dTDP-4-dehydrorhamnose 3,5-epimerase-like enzyme